MAAYVQFNRPGKNGMSLDYGPFTHVFVTRGTIYGHCTMMQDVMLGCQEESRDWMNLKDGEVYTDVVIYTKE